MKKLTIPCVPMKQGDYTLYLFAISAKDLWERVQINKREEDKDTGYQRTLSPSRVAAIAKYVKAKNPIPLSVLISFDGKVKVDKNGSTIALPAATDLGWVIDGQHRLAGMHKAGTDMEIGVVAFLGLDEEEQIQQFVTINREGKGVPTSLYYDLLKSLPKKKTESEIAKERAADIANSMKRDEESIFFNRIVVVTSPGKGQLSLTNFVRKVAPLVQPNKGKFGIYTEPEQRLILENYFQGLKLIFPKDFRSSDSMFFKTLGFGAAITALPTAFDLSLKHYKSFIVKDVAEVFRKIQDFDFGAWEKMGSGSAAELQAGDDLRQELLAAWTMDDDDGMALKLT